MYLTDLGSNPYIIGDDNYQNVIQETQDGGFSTGMARRDYNRYREGFYAPMTRQEIFPRSKWDDLIKMQDDNQSSPWHWEKALDVPVLDQNGQGYCHPAGGLVLMGSGELKPIEDIVPGDVVVSAEGKKRKVMKKGARYVNESMYQLRCFGYTAMECTGEHPVLTQRGYVPARDLKNEDMLSFPKWTRTLSGGELSKHLCIHDYVSVEVSEGAELVSVPHGSWRGTDKTPGYDESTDKYYVDQGSLDRVPDFIALDEDAGRLFGLWLAEGSYIKDGSKRYGLQFSFSRSKEEHTLVPETIDLIEKVFGLKAGIKQMKHNVTCVMLHSTVIANAFHTLMGEYSDAKKIPGEFMNATDEFKHALIRGWLSGDGCFVQDRWKGCTVSRSLAVSLFIMGNSLGLRPSLQKEKPQVNEYAASRKTAWKILFQSQKDSYRIKDDEDRVWRRIRRIEGDVDARGRKVVDRPEHSRPYSGFVYALTVDGDESYIIDGCAVHNCWMYGTVAGVMNRYAANGYNPVPFLSAHGPAWQGKSGRDQGGWAGEAVMYIEKYGIPTTDTWPEKSMNGRVHAASHEQQLDAARHKIVAFEELQRQNFEQAVSCLLDPTRPCPVTLGLMWWGHLVCGVRAVKIDRNEYGIEIKNSWRSTWGNGGFAVLKESKATAHEYIAIRQVKQRAA